MLANTTNRSRSMNEYELCIDIRYLRRHQIPANKQLAHMMSPRTTPTATMTG